MPTTNFLIPSSITQLSSVNGFTNKPSIDWELPANIISKDSYAMTVKPLHTISGFWSEKFYSETSQIRLTNFNIPLLTQPITGFELQLNVQRAARIQDLVIQLILNDELIGDNRASEINPVQSDMYTGELTVPLHPVQDYNIYGGPTDMWGTELTAEDIRDSSFGVAISFRSNMIVPHTDLVYVDQAAIRITYG